MMDCIYEMSHCEVIYWVSLVDSALGGFSAWDHLNSHHLRLEQRELWENIII